MSVRGAGFLGRGLSGLRVVYLGGWACGGLIILGFALGQLRFHEGLLWGFSGRRFFGSRFVGARIVFLLWGLGSRRSNYFGFVSRFAVVQFCFGFLL